MLKHLNIDEMVALTDAWVNDPTRKAKFLSVLEIAPLHPKIVAVHRDLLATQPVDGASSPEIKKVIAQSVAVDIVHDAHARAVSAGVESDRTNALARERPDVERANLAEQVQAKLFPNGLNIVNASTLAESGNTARVAKLLHAEPAIATYLRSIPLHGHTTLMDTAERWIAAGAKLGKLEQKREDLEAHEAGRPGGRATLNALRGRWIRLVSQVLANLEISDADAETIETIRGPVLKAAERASGRYADAVAGGGEEAGDGAGTGAKVAATEGAAE